MKRTLPRNSNTTEDDLETVSPTIEKKEDRTYQDKIPIINISNKPCQFRNSDKQPTSKDLYLRVKCVTLYCRIQT